MNVCDGKICMGSMPTYVHFMEPPTPSLTYAATVDEPDPVKDATGSVAVEGIPVEEEEDSERPWAICCSTS